MRFRTVCAMATAVSICACSSDPTSPGPGPDLPSSQPDLAGIAAQVNHESGYTPGGYASQYDVWLRVPPDSVPGTGVVIGKSAEVFIEGTGGALTAATAADIQVGDQIEIWKGAGSVYGSDQAPPGAPAYSAVEVVILRDFHRPS